MTVQSICAFVMLVIALWAPVRRRVRGWRSSRERGSQERLRRLPPADSDLMGRPDADVSTATSAHADVTAIEWRLLWGGATIATLAALVVKVAAAPFGGVTELVTLSVIGLLFAVGVCAGPRRPTRWLPASLLLMAAAAIVALLLNPWTGDLGWELRLVGASFMPLAATAIAFRMPTAFTKGSVFTVAIIYTFASSFTFGIYTIGILVALAVTMRGPDRFRVLALPALTVIILSVLLLPRLGARYQWKLSSWWPGADPLGNSWQVDSYRRVLELAEPFGDARAPAVPHGGTTGWFVSLAAELGVVPAVVILVVVLVTYWRITMHAWRLVHNQPDAFTLAAPLVPVAAVSFLMQIGAVPLFGVAPIPFMSIASGPLWLVLALCALRWPVLRDRRAPNTATPRPGRGLETEKLGAPDRSETVQGTSR